MSFSDDGSSWRSWGPETVESEHLGGKWWYLSLTSDDLEQQLGVYLR